MKDIVFPRAIQWIGECCYVVPSDRRSHYRPFDPATDKYRTVVFEGKGWGGHRLSYHLNVNPIPRRPADLKEGLVLHSCDNAWCVNPDHLSIGTCKQNAIEKSVRNHEWRQKTGKFNLGKTRDDKFKADCSKRMKGNRLRRGTTLSQSTKSKISKSLEGNKRRAGILHSEETKARIKASCLKAWAKRHEK
jgi:hypothetical protein